MDSAPVDRAAGDGGCARRGDFGALLPLWLAAAIGSLVACGVGCKSRSPSSDANSNWLAVCDEHADCDDGTACICGLCTRVCEAGSDCAGNGVKSTCVTPSDATDDLLCNGVLRGSEQNICLAECRDNAGCREGHACRAGACWRVMASDGPTSGPGDMDMPGTPADAGPDDMPKGNVVMADPIDPRVIDAGQDVWTIDASIDFQDPVELPPPTHGIEVTQDTPSLTGTWRDQSGDWRRLRLDITQDGSGLTGTVMLECEGCEPRGPVAPATDPEAGHPAGLSVAEQSRLRTNTMGHQPYRILGGRADHEGLSFWFSNQDLWRDWCALQTPHPVEIAGRTQYTCVADPMPYDLVVPPDADARHVLCTSDNPVCSCNAQACAARLEQGVNTVRVRFEEGALVGTWSVTQRGSSDTLLVQLVRVEDSP